MGKGERIRLERRIAELEARVAELMALVDALRAENAELKARLGVNSQNSSKPPSSDGPDTPKRRAREPSGRKPGGQPGHEQHTRKLLPADRTCVYRPEACESCHGSLGNGEVVEESCHQAVELPEIHPEVTDHVCLSVECPNCRHVTAGHLPDEVPRGGYGPRLCAYLGVLSGRYRASRREVAALFEEMFHCPISVGTVSNICVKAGALMKAPVLEVAAALPTAATGNADETGYKYAGNKGWLWLVVTPAYTLFLLAATRGADAAKQLLAGFRGVLGTDRYKGYDWYKHLRQLCWAHLKRNFQALVDRGGPAADFGNGGLEIVSRLFEVWHRDRDGPRTTLVRHMQPIKEDCLALLLEHFDSPSPKARGMARDLMEAFDRLWVFVTTPGAQPTNNSAERAGRPAVLWRKGSFGTQSEGGVAFVQGILTVSATCKQQGRPLLNYLVDLFDADRRGVPPPKLLYVS